MSGPAQRRPADKPPVPAELEDDALDAAQGASGRRAELDHVGAYNFGVEISGVDAGQITASAATGETGRR